MDYLIVQEHILGTWTHGIDRHLKSTAFDTRHRLANRQHTN